MKVRLLKEVKKPTGKAYFKKGTILPVNKEWGLRMLMSGEAVEVKEMDEALVQLTKAAILAKHNEEEE